MQPTTATASLPNLAKDLTAGLVVFLVALPLCLGVALASNAPLLSGIIAGIVGGILVGVLSGSHSSVSGPAAGLTAVVAAQIAALGSFPAFLLAVVLAGVMQIVLGAIRAGSIASFVPTSVIKGLLAAIGVILILKQLPHVFGYDADPDGEMAFVQPDGETTFSELFRMFDAIHPGATVIGLLSIALLIGWDRVPFLKGSPLPSALVVVLIGVAMTFGLDQMGGAWAIGPSHLVQVPVAETLSGFLGFLQLPDFSQLVNPAVYVAAVTIAAVASLETLLNLEAVDKLDPKQRTSPPNRELMAQGVGNLAAGMIGGIPVTSVIIRSSVNLNTGAQSRLSTIFHGFLLLISVAMLPSLINRIPLACLAAILLLTGYKLASPKLVKQMWREGWSQFIPFIVTVLAIVFTDLLIGVLIGLVVSIGFILRSSLRRPLRRFIERHLGGDVLRIELASQVSFLNRAVLAKTFSEVQKGQHLLLDARNTEYIDPDVLDLITDFREKTAPARGVEVSLLGFRDSYPLEDKIQYVDYSTRELQQVLTPGQVLQLLKEGHERSRTDQRLTRHFERQVNATAGGQHPLAVVLSCIDSRTPTELLFDMGIGDLFGVRVAGNVVSTNVLGSMEYGCAVAGAKLILVMGHTRCGAVTAAVGLLGQAAEAAERTGCQHITPIVDAIQQSADEIDPAQFGTLTGDARLQAVDEVARRNVLRVCEEIQNRSDTLRALVADGRIAVVGAMYDVTTGNIEFLSELPTTPIERVNGVAVAA